MDKRYWWAAGLFAAVIAALAAIATLLLPRVGAAPLAIAAATAYGAALLFDLLPPGQARDTEGTPLQPTTRVAAATALGGIAAMVTVSLAVTALGGSAPTNARLSFEPADDTTPTAAIDTTPPSTPRIALAETTRTPSPTATPSPTSEPVPPTATVPDSPFANCTRVEGSVYTCGDQPWRVICAPGGYFFDPEGAIPDPIPREWRGWSETTLTERLEYIHTACPGNGGEDDHAD